MTIKHSIYLLLLAVIPLFAGCGADEESVDERKSAAARSLECEIVDFPCTWDEVPPAVKEQTVTLGEVAGLYGVNVSLADISSFLLEQPEVVYTEVLGTGVRYRVEGGRPAWVYPRDELAHHSIDTGIDQEGVEPGAQVSTAPVGPSLTQAVSQIGRWLGPPRAYAQSVDEADRHGVAAEIVGRGKRALILSPFEWEWLLKRQEHTAEAMARLAAYIKDYQPEHGGEVVFHADVYQFEDNPVGPQQRVLLSDEVQFADFLKWDTFNTVVLATHGTRHRCSREPPVGGKKIPVDPADSPAGDTSDDCPLIWAGRAKQSDYGAYVGVEIVSFVGMEYREFPGLTRPEAAQCVEDLHSWRQAGKKGLEPTTLDGKPCRLGQERGKDMIALWTPFFEAQYPGGLNNVILFLASCRSAVNDVLLKQFAQKGNKQVAVFGFDDAVAAVDGFRLAYKMIELIEKGVDNQGILKALKEMDRSRTTHLRGRALALGDEVLPATPAELIEVSENRTHGRDIVMLVDAAGTELGNESTVRVVETRGQPDDHLALQAQVIGLDADFARSLSLQVHVAGEADSGERYRPSREVSPWVYRHPGDVSLGRKAQDGEIVDLEVSVEFPGGNKSLWKYENITLTTQECAWSASVTGHSPAQGDFSGTSGSIKIDDGSWPPLSIDAVVQDEDPQPQPPWLVIRLQNYDRTKLADPSFVSEIHFALPNVKPGQIGAFQRVWGKLVTGPQSHSGNADYLRRDLVGLPEGSGIGHLLTSSVNLTRNDGERLEGTFDARFLNQRVFRELDILDQHPLGVGVHAISKAEFRAQGQFSLQASGCGGGFRRSR